MARRASPSPKIARKPAKPSRPTVAPAIRELQPVATRANAGAGNLLAFIIGLVLLVAMIGAPFFARFVQSDDSRLSDVVRDDVESIRRIVLNIDENLGAVARLAELRGAVKDGPSVDDVIRDHPELFNSVMPDLDASTRSLKKVSDEDKSKKLELPGAVPTGKPSKAEIDKRRDYIARNDSLLKEAKQIANRIKGATQGEARGADSLSVNRVLALLGLAEGRMNANQAEFDRLLAADLRSEAERRLIGVSALRMAAARAEAGKPSVDMEHVNDDLTKTDAEIGKLDERIADLKSQISTRETALASAQASAKAARASMASVDAKTIVGSTGQQYESWSNEARKAEASIAALRFGTLEGAQLPPEVADDLLNGAYEGGKAVPGLRDLKLQLAAVEATHAQMDKTKTDLEARKKALEDRDSQLATAQSDLGGEASKHTDQILAQLEAAQKLDDSADKTSETAIKSFKEALGYSKKAATAAAGRQRAAQQAGTSSPGAPEKATDRMVKDRDTEAAMTILSAELSYQIALENWRHLRSMQAHHAAQTRVADISGGDKPADVSAAIETIRTEGLTEIENSIKAYTAAGSMIKQSSFKGLEGPTISGAQSMWQVQVAQAAAGLLKSHLIAEPVDAQTARDEAYALLGEAVKGREGSPLLTPALGTFIYLQKAAGQGTAPSPTPSPTSAPES